MSDLISRSEAIEFIDAGHLCNPNEPRWSDNEVVNFLKSRPSAQPVDKDMNVPCTDTISRKAAIDAHYEYCNKHPDAGFPVWSLKILEDLPSAQPEPCEDAVSRQAVYNVLDKMPVRGFKKDGETIHGLISLSQVNSAIINLPSVQPDLPDWAQKVEEYRKSAPSYKYGV